MTGLSCEKLSVRGRLARDVGSVEEIGDYRDQVRAGGDDLRRIVDRDAADRADRLCKAMFEERKRSAQRGWLGGRGEDAAERYIVRPRGERSPRRVEPVIA